MAIKQYMVTGVRREQGMWKSKRRCYQTCPTLTPACHFFLLLLPTVVKHTFFKSPASLIGVPLVEYNWDSGDINAGVIIKQKGPPMGN